MITLGTRRRTRLDKVNYQKRALIIGISEYDTYLRPLEFCAEDGRDMYELLKMHGYQIFDNHKLIGHIKHEILREAIYDFFTNPDIKAEDTLLFYYSGHGIPDVSGDVYLSSSEINPDAPFRKGFSFTELTNMIQRSVSTRIVTILDSCYSGAAKLTKGQEEAAALLGAKGDEQAAANHGDTSYQQSIQNARTRRRKIYSSCQPIY